MYVLGHWATTRASDAFAAADLTGLGIVALMLPDIARCHDWGYARCHDPVPANDVDLALVRAHMLGDWYVHYGEGDQPIRRGWAYRSMAPFARLYDEFFATAEAEGLRRPDMPRDSIRGFAHTMVEYAIDTWVADHDPTTTEGFVAAKRALSDIPVDTARALLSRAGADFPAEQLETGIASFTDRIRRCQTPHQFAFRAGAKKFGLIGDAGVELVARFVRRGARQIPDAEFSAILAETSRFIAAKLGHNEHEAPSWT